MNEEPMKRERELAADKNKKKKKKEEKRESAKKLSRISKFIIIMLIDVNFYLEWCMIIIIAFSMKPQQQQSDRNIGKAQQENRKSMLAF